MTYQAPPARTIADLEGVEQIKTHHLAEALQYRPRRRNDNMACPQLANGHDFEALSHGEWQQLLPFGLWDSGS